MKGKENGKSILRDNFVYYYSAHNNLIVRLTTMYKKHKHISHSYPINKKRGHLKIFLGYAPGVGKTYSMLSDGNSRLEQGINIVIGYLDTHNRTETEKQILNLKAIPRKKIIYNNLIFEEMDTDAIIALHPHTVLVDEFAHTNVPGSKYTKRFEDVSEILNNEINVISTLNIQHLESLNDIVRQITGIKVKETIPDKIVENADEIVVIDITPDALQNRLKRGNIYKDDVADRALKNFFRKGNLNALREITLRQTAEDVNEELKDFMHTHRIKGSELVMVCVSPNPYSTKLIRRGARIAKTYKCNWLVLAVNCTNIFAPKLTSIDIRILEAHKKLTTQLGGDFFTLTGKSVSTEITRFITEKHITQIILGHSKRTKLQTFLRGSTISKLMKYTRNVEFHIIPNEL